MGRYRWGRLGTLYEIMDDQLWGPRPLLVSWWLWNWVSIFAWAFGVDFKWFWPEAPDAGWYNHYGRKTGIGEDR